jgi:glucosamine--fructose-6-phosphate aminotransferase (isomerizing)
VIEKIKSSGLYDLFMRRCSPGDLMDRSIHVSPETLIFTYKTALITGDLGDNTRYLRKSIREDPIIHLVMEHAPDDSQMYLAHTRWASVGAINEANCHPVNNFISAGGSGEEWDFSPATKKFPFYGSGPWAINVVLNGDIDNYPSLKDSLESNGWRIDSRVSTDTKVIPLQIEKYLLEGHDLKEAFRRAVCDFEGSHAIAVESNLEPGRVFLALKGSGQTIYVGICERQYVFSSEVYGLVEETPDFIKMDGERQRIPGDERTRGQIFVLSNTSGGGLEGIEAMYYDGHPLRLGPEDVRHAEITTRDIDRGAHPHFLLKEIMDSPQSIRKTMRGKYRIEKDQGVVFNLDEAVFPRRVRDALVSGEIRHIYVVGQGTAAVAGAAVAEALSFYLKGTRISVQARKASDLSGFCLDDDMGGLPGDRHHPVGHHHGHQPGRGHGQGAGRPPHRHREPEAVRHHNQGRRGLLHERRPRHRDVRGIHQGVLLTDHGGLSPGPVHGPDAGHALERENRGRALQARAGAEADAEGHRRP